MKWINAILIVGGIAAIMMVIKYLIPPGWFEDTSGIPHDFALERHTRNVFLMGTFCILIGLVVIGMVSNWVSNWLIAREELRFKEKVTPKSYRE